MAGARRHLDWLDYGRFAAATAVVSFHYLINGPRRNNIEAYDVIPFAPAEYGHMGVDAFFIISGFVIMMSAGNTTVSSFARSRFIRLWPTFALCMTITAIVRVVSGKTGMEVEFSH